MLAFTACDAAGTCLDRGGNWNPELGQCEPAPENPAPTAPVHGDWQVVAFEQPGVTALPPSEADAWIGTVAHFSDSLAVLGDDRCETPDYFPDTTTANRFLQDYRIAPSMLGLGDTILFTRVRCGGDWISPAATLYHQGSDLLTVWDGTFFVLRRR
ncbi:MAG: hypothetical protein ACREK5_00370 [Gemmatimonadota bacterium]